MLEAFSRKFNMLKLASLALLSVLIASAPFDVLAAGYKFEKRTQETFPVKGIKVVRVENSRGDVKVVGSRDVDSVLLTVSKRVKAGGKEEAVEIAGMLKVSTEIDGDILIVKARYPEKERAATGLIGLLFGRGTRYSMDLTLEIPASLDCKVLTASGDVSIEGVNGTVKVSTASGDLKAAACGELRVETSSGDIKVDDINGPVRITTASGDVSGGRVEGEVHVQTASGDVALRGVSGDVSIATASGDAVIAGAGGISFNGVSGSLRARNIRGAMEVSTSSGDVFARVVPEGGCDYEVSTSSGDVILHFRKIMDGGFMLDAQTASGDISAYLPIDIIKISRNVLRGRVGKGNNRVAIHTASGDIVLKKLEE